MSVIALAPRTVRRPAPPAAGRRAPERRHGVAGPALTVTVAIPLSGAGLSAHTRQLLQTIQHLVEAAHGSLTVTGAAALEQTGPQLVTAERPGADPAPAGGAPDQHAEVQILAASRQVLRGGVAVALTRLEHDLLSFLARHPRRVFSRVQLLAAVWGYEHTGVRTVDVHVRRLRHKIGDEVPLVATVHGVGYRLADDARVSVAAGQ